ncbi:uncharacterized protein [Mobula birostris]|uniref:uncharacterized protein isoform X2 n=1 Tax=Mobula birostris TaxID=1983395 RepID=UPI003B283ADC
MNVQTILLPKLHRTSFTHQGCLESPSKHNFSKHDSQLVFYDGATYMENQYQLPPKTWCPGLMKTCTDCTDHQYKNKGKYRTKSALGGSSEFKKDLISWIPTQSEGQQEWPIISTYQADFWHHRNPQSTAVMIPQLLVPRVRQLITVTNPRVETMQTTYRQFYSHCQPNPNVHTNIYTGIVQRMPMEKEATFVYVNPRPKLANGRSRPRSSLSECFTVADCLSWNVPQKCGTSD